MAPNGIQIKQVLLDLNTDNTTVFIIVTEENTSLYG